MKIIVTAMLVLSCFAVGCRADFQPGLIVDQANQHYMQGLNVQSFGPIGESFTPTLNGIQWAAIDLQDSTANPTLGGVFQVKLLQGDGTSGTLLATSAATGVPPGFGPGLGAYAYFYFATEVTLTPGMPYSLILNQLSGENFLVGGVAGGEIGDQAILFGQPQSNFNLTFGEGVLSVAEPSSLVLVAIGVVSVMRRRWRTPPPRFHHAPLP